MGQNMSHHYWPIRANGNDTSDPGTILRVFGSEDGSVSLRTEFGKWLVMRNGTLTANTSDRLEGGVGANFYFSDHPLRGRSDGNVICWRTWSGTYVGVGANGTLIETTAVRHDKRTKFRMARLGRDRIALQSSEGLVVADKDLVAWREWQHWFKSTQGYQSHQLELESRRFLERFGWHRGWVVGIIVGGFIMLTVHNVAFALKDNEVAFLRRLQAFDIARFILEYLVIYSHLATLLGLEDWGISQWLTAYKMPSFAFIAGVFGSSLAYDSMAKMLCYTLGTSVIALILRLIEIQAIWGSDLLSEQIGRYFNIDEFAPGLWFLANLFVWRLTITPLFFVARRMLKPEVAVVLTFVFIWVFSFLLLGWTKHFTVWIYGQYNWQHLLFYAPFFAAGLLKAPEEWNDIFQRRAFQAVCALFFLAFHVLAAIPGFKQWTRSTSCLPSDTSSCFFHMYPQAIYYGPSAGAFFYDLFLFIMRSGLAVSTACLLCAGATLLADHLPQAADIVARLGSRTLFAYVIHIHLFNMLEKDGYVTDVTIHWSSGVKLFVALVLAAVVLISLSTRGTEFWFQWLLRPYWIKDFIEWALHGCPRRADVGKAGLEHRGAEEPAKEERQKQPENPGKRTLAAAADAGNEDATPTQEEGRLPRHL